MTTVASVLHLSRGDIKALRVTDTYSLHRVVYSLFDDVRRDEEKLKGAPSGFLFADAGGDFHGRKILLLSNRQPKSQTDDGYGEVQSKEVAESFLEHEDYSFQVIVNPVQRKSGSGRIIPVRGRAEIADWFFERAANNWGFSVPKESLEVGQTVVDQFKEKHGNLVTIGRTSMQGQLRVTDPARFKMSFKQGIGRSRAFGCGLLQIAPLTNTLFS